MEENTLYEGQEEGFSLCLQVRSRLPELLEGYLDAMAAEAIRAHLAVCYLCARELSEMERVVKLVETLPFVEPVTDFRPAIMAALRAQPAYSFQAPVVEVEAPQIGGSLWPRTTTGQQRLRSLWRAGLQVFGPSGRLGPSLA